MALGPLLQGLQVESFSSGNDNNQSTAEMTGSSETDIFISLQVGTVEEGSKRAAAAANMQTDIITSLTTHFKLSKWSKRDAAVSVTVKSPFL